MEQLVGVSDMVVEVLIGDGGGGTSCRRGGCGETSWSRCEFLVVCVVDVRLPMCCNVQDAEDMWLVETSMSIMCRSR